MNIDHTHRRSTDTESSLENKNLLKSIEERQGELTTLSRYLTELESQLSLIFASSPDIIMLLDNEDRILKISNAARHILGYDKEEMISKQIWDFLVPEDVEITKERQKQIKKETVAYFDGENTFVNNWKTKNNTIARLLWRFSVCVKNQLIGVATDITHFGTNAFYNLKLLQSTFDCTTDGIVVTDASKENPPIVYVNKAYEKISGYSHEELVGQTCSVLNTEETTNSRALRTLYKSRKEGKSCDVLLQSRGKDGRLYYAQIFASCVIESGVIINYIGVVRDVTDLIGIDYDWSPNTERGFYPLISLSNEPAI